MEVEMLALGQREGGYLGMILGTTEKSRDGEFGLPL